MGLCKPQNHVPRSGVLILGDFPLLFFFFFLSVISSFKTNELRTAGSTSAMKI